MLVRAPRAGTIEARVAELKQLESKVDPAALDHYNQRFDMSWIYHDNALEGVVYSLPELELALRDEPPADPALLPMFDAVRQHRHAIAWVRQQAAVGQDVNLDATRKLLLTLAPEEAEGKGPPRYRKDMPVHRLYFHEISPPDKIGYKMRQLTQWLSSPETKRHTHPVRVAARAHHTFLHIYPFSKHNGKIGRLLMNLLLLREGYPPAVVHATDRQRYYDALKSSPDELSSLVQESLTNSIEASARHFRQLLGML